MLSNSPFKEKLGSRRRAIVGQGIRETLLSTNRHLLTSCLHCLPVPQQSSDFDMRLLESGAVVSLWDCSADALGEPVKSLGTSARAVASGKPQADARVPGAIVEGKYSDESRRGTRWGCEHDRLASLGGLLVLDWCYLRPLGRPRDILGDRQRIDAHGLPSAEPPETWQ